MLRYFRINDPYRLLGLLFILLIIYLPLFLDSPGVTVAELKAFLIGEKIDEGRRMYVEIADNTAPFSAWFHGLMDMLFGRSLLARHIIAFIIVFIHSAYIGIVFITKKAFNENTFIPSFVFSILYFFSFDTLALTDELLGSGFLLLAMNNVFKEIEFRSSSDETLLSLGIYVAFASLFHFPYMIFLFGILVILFLFARTTLRKILLLIFGFMLPHLLMLTIAYMKGSAGAMWEYYYMSNLLFGGEMLVSLKGMILLGIIPIVYFAISMVMLNRLARFSKYQSQVLQSIFLWIGFCFIYFIFVPELRPQSFVVLIPPLSFLFTNFLLLIRRKRLAEMNTWILLVGIVAFSYLARYDKLGAVSYGRLIVAENETSIKNTRILVLGDNPQMYIDNRSASPFVNWKIARPIFSSPEYYESIANVYNGLTLDPPDLIVDNENLLKPFLDRIPELRKIYRREGNAYKKISS